MQPFRPRACKAERKHNFASLVVLKLGKTRGDTNEMLSLLKKLRTKLKHVT